MDSRPAAENEVRALTDALFDGKTDAANMQRLEALILQDLGSLQQYVERINFHGVISQTARTTSSEETAVAVLDKFARAVHLREQRDRRLLNLAVASLVMCTLGIVGWFVTQSSLLQPIPVATISNLSLDVDTSGPPLELGRVLCRGDRLQIRRGLVSLQLPHVLVDVQGPASVKILDGGRIQLNEGAVFAQVQTQGRGFAVRTPSANVVDFGTEFLVQHHAGTGTDVSVRRGRVQASLLNEKGYPTQQFDLTDRRSANFTSGTGEAREVAYPVEAFEVVDRNRGGIARIDGMLRTTNNPPPSLLAGQVPTHNHILVIPEQQQITLDRELTLQGLEGPVHLPAGSVVSSYLIHYDPPGDLSLAPRGGVTFQEEVAAVIIASSQLQASDQIWGLPAIRFEQNSFRGLELGPDEDDEDQLQISADRHTVSFHFDMSPPQFLDEARILVVRPPNSADGTP